MTIVNKAIWAIDKLLIVSKLGKKVRIKGNEDKGFKFGKPILVSDNLIKRVVKYKSIELIKMTKLTIIGSKERRFNWGDWAKKVLPSLVNCFWRVICLLAIWELQPMNSPETVMVTKTADTLVIVWVKNVEI